jgi:hypothetical protein
MLLTYFVQIFNNLIEQLDPPINVIREYLLLAARSVYGCAELIMAARFGVISVRLQIFLLQLKQDVGFVSGWNLELVLPCFKHLRFLVESDLSLVLLDILVVLELSILIEVEVADLFLEPAVLLEKKASAYNL